VEVKWASTAEEDLIFWQRSNPAVVDRIHKLIESIKTSAYKGIGKPEPLKGNLSGWWSRRITLEHRLVYRVEKSTLFIVQARYHY
jgi:toxin YoeB